MWIKGMPLLPPLFYSSLGSVLKLVDGLPVNGRVLGCAERRVGWLTILSPACRFEACQTCQLGECDGGTNVTQHPFRVLCILWLAITTPIMMVGVYRAVTPMPTVKQSIPIQDCQFSKNKCV